MQRSSSSVISLVTTLPAPCRVEDTVPSTSVACPPTVTVPPERLLLPLTEMSLIARLLPVTSTVPAPLTARLPVPSPSALSLSITSVPAEPTW